MQANTHTFLQTLFDIWFQTFSLPLISCTIYNVLSLFELLIGHTFFSSLKHSGISLKQNQRNQRQNTTQHNKKTNKDKTQKKKKKKKKTRQNQTKDKTQRNKKTNKSKTKTKPKTKHNTEHKTQKQHTTHTQN